MLMNDDEGGIATTFAQFPQEDLTASSRLLKVTGVEGRPPSSN